MKGLFWLNSRLWKFNCSWGHKIGENRPGLSLPNWSFSVAVVSDGQRMTKKKLWTTMILRKITVWLHHDQTSKTKSSQTEPDQKMAGSIWLPGPEVYRKLQGSWPDYARQHQNVHLCIKKTVSGVVWHNLANLFQVSCKLLAQEAR